MNHRVDFPIGRATSTEAPQVSTAAIRHGAMRLGAAYSQISYVEIVTRLTLKTHALADRSGAVIFTVKAMSGPAYRDLSASHL